MRSKTWQKLVLILISIYSPTWDDWNSLDYLASGGRSNEVKLLKIKIYIWSRWVWWSNRSIDFTARSSVTGRRRNLKLINPHFVQLRIPVFNFENSVHFVKTQRRLFKWSGLNSWVRQQHKADKHRVELDFYLRPSGSCGVKNTKAPQLPFPRRSPSSSVCAPRAARRDQQMFRRLNQSRLGSTWQRVYLCPGLLCALREVRRRFWSPDWKWLVAVAQWTLTHSQTVCLAEAGLCSVTVRPLAASVGTGLRPSRFDGLMKTFILKTGSFKSSLSRR